MPGWLATRLVSTAGLRPEQVAAMDAEQATDAWTGFSMTRRRQQDGRHGGAGGVAGGDAGVRRRAGVGTVPRPKSVLLALVGEVGELAELLQWLPADDVRALAGQEPLRTRAGEEMADVLLYLVLLADVLDIDLGAAAEAKLAAAHTRYPAAGRMAGCLARRCRKKSRRVSISAEVVRREERRGPIGGPGARGRTPPWRSTWS